MVTEVQKKFSRKKFSRKEKRQIEVSFIRND